MDEVTQYLEDTGLDEILDERNRQDAKWGGSAHDDEHSPWEWYGILASEMNEVHQSLTIQGDNTREELVQVAAVALAWLQSMDRKA